MVFNVRYRLTPIRIERFFVCLKSVTPIAIWIAAQLLTPPCYHLSVTWPPTILLLTFWMQFLPYLFDYLHMHECACNYLHTNKLHHTYIHTGAFPAVQLPQHPSI